MTVEVGWVISLQDPFTFSNYHPRMTDPYDYYTFGQNYVRPLVDYRWVCFWVSRVAKLISNLLRLLAEAVVI